MTTAAVIEFYKLPGCPYCAKVEHKLDELDVEYVEKRVPGRKGQRDEVFEVSGQYGVPVISDPANDIEGMAESEEIVTYLERTYG